MAERKYSESDWAVRRWDRFNKGRAVKPLSFCQFWRTVILYVTLQQLLWPAKAVMGVAVRLKRFAPLGAAVVVVILVTSGGAISGSNLVVSLVLGIILGMALGFILAFDWMLTEDFGLRLGAILLSFGRSIRQGLWLLAWPLRVLSPPVGRRLLAGAVTVGEPVAVYSQRHKEGLETIGTVLVLLALIAIVGFVVVVMVISNWLLSLSVAGALIALLLAGILGIPQAAWRVFAAVMGLLWGAAVAAKHGVWPPVTIVRSN